MLLLSQKRQVNFSVKLFSGNVLEMLESELSESKTIKNEKPREAGQINIEVIASLSTEHHFWGRCF
jgi:hypothetical protein